MICEALLVKNAQHGFDKKARVGWEVHCTVVELVVDFVCQVLGGQRATVPSRGTAIIV